MLKRKPYYCNLGDRSVTTEDYFLNPVGIANIAEGVPVFVYRRLDDQTIVPAQIGDEFTDKAGQLWLTTPTGWLPAALEQ